MLCYHFSVFAKQQADAPQAAKTDDGKDYPRNNFALSTEKPADKVEAEQSDQTPVDCADDNQSKCDSIKNLHECLLLPTLFYDIGRKISIDFYGKKM